MVSLFENYIFGCYAYIKYVSFQFYFSFQFSFLKYLFNEKIKMHINYYDIFLLDFLKYVFIDRSFHLSFQNYVYFYCIILTACLLHENVMFFLFHQKKHFIIRVCRIGFVSIVPLINYWTLTEPVSTPIPQSAVKFGI